jgi:hypothetical protein
MTPSSPPGLRPRQSRLILSRHNLRPPPQCGIGRTGTRRQRDTSFKGHIIQGTRRLRDTSFKGHIVQGTRRLRDTSSKCHIIQGTHRPRGPIIEETHRPKKKVWRFIRRDGLILHSTKLIINIIIKRNSKLPVSEIFF